MRDKIIRCHFLNEIIRNLSEVLVSEGICDCVCCVCVCVCVCGCVTVCAYDEA
jgi:hypothetical protein